MAKQCEERFKLCGLTAAQIEERLTPFLAKGLNFKVSEDCLDALVTMTSDLPYEQFAYVKNGVYAAFEDEVYSVTDESLQSIAGRLLKMTGRRISVAESLTGGEICSRLIEVPGMSASFYEGVVCYDRMSKAKRLGVPLNTLALYGAVSRETAVAMVKGLIEDAPADIGLATTGLAGPTGDEGKPVGLVYIAVGGGNFITAFERQFCGDRNHIRNCATNMALFYLVRYLKGDILRL